MSFFFVAPTSNGFSFFVSAQQGFFSSFSLKCCSFMSVGTGTLQRFPFNVVKTENRYPLCRSRHHVGGGTRVLTREVFERFTQCTYRVSRDLLNASTPSCDKLKDWGIACQTSASWRNMWTRRFWQQAISRVCRLHSRTRTRVKTSLIAENLQARYFDHRIPTCRTSTLQKQQIRGTPMILLTNRFPNNPRSSTSLQRETESQHQPQEEVISLHQFFPYPLTTHSGTATHPRHT